MKPVFLTITLCFAFSVQVLYSQDLTVDITQEGVSVAEGDKKVLFYQKRPKSLDGKYERAGYVHPLYGLRGEILTEDFPEDHPHQRGVFWAWHQIILDGEKIADGWTCENISWDVKEVKVKKNNTSVKLTAIRFWNVDLVEEKPESVIREKTDITVFKTNDNYRTVDFAIHLLPLLDELKIGGSDDEKGYGGFSPRFKLPEDITFISNGKLVESQTTAVDAGPWMDFYGSFGGVNEPKSGIAVFNHPDNPEPRWDWILRAKNSMQNAVYPGRNPVSLPPKGITLKYRMVIHEGDAEEANLNELYREYKNLP